MARWPRWLGGSGAALPDAGPPRPFHYAVAHTVLPALATSHPAFTVAALSGDRAPALLAQVVEQVRLGMAPATGGVEGSQHAGDEAAPDAGAFGPEAMRVHRRKIDDRPAVVVELPEPKGISEAWFVGIVLLAPANASPERLKAAAGCCFTLEFAGRRRDGQPVSMLGAWLEQGRHVNYGAGPAPTIDAFVRAIGERLDQDGIADADPSG